MSDRFLPITTDEARVLVTYLEKTLQHHIPDDDGDDATIDTLVGLLTRLRTGLVKDTGVHQAINASVNGSAIMIGKVTIHDQRF